MPKRPRPATFAIQKVTPTVDASGIMASLPRHALLLIDARAPERYRGETEPLDPVAGHIPGARNRPYTQNLAADGTFKHRRASCARSSRRVLDGAGHDLVVHQCGSGVTACHNILAMEIAGFEGTRLYPGSWSEWCADPARPIATGRPEERRAEESRRELSAPADTTAGPTVMTLRGAPLPRGAIRLQPAMVSGQDARSR